MKFNLPQFMINVNKNNSAPEKEVSPALQPGSLLKEGWGLPCGKPVLFTGLQ